MLRTLFLSALLCVGYAQLRVESIENAETLMSVPPQTVTELDVPAYLGNWFQMYASLIPTHTYELDGYCITAQYIAIQSEAGTTFKIVNSENIGSPNGKHKQITGVATNVWKDKQLPVGQFIVKFDGNEDIDFYWIIALGPIENGQYSWSVVSTPFAVDLFILARDPKTFEDKYEVDVLALVKSKGFDKFYNKPIPTPQSSQCQYPFVAAVEAGQGALRARVGLF